MLFRGKSARGVGGVVDPPCRMCRMLWPYAMALCHCCSDGPSHGKWYRQPKGASLLGGGGGGGGGGAHIKINIDGVVGE